jgi:hypothetical protein
MKFRQYLQLFSEGASWSRVISKTTPPRHVQMHLQVYQKMPGRRNIFHDSAPVSSSTSKSQQSSAPETREQLPITSKHYTQDLPSIAHWTPPNKYYHDMLYNEEWRKYNNSANLRSKLISWIESGPPPLSEYKLTFGKHRGKLLEEVPASYLVKYLIPTKGYCGDCPIVGLAVDDFLKRHPNVKSQAGRAKTKPLEEGILTDQVPVKRKRGRPKKIVTE